jgi:hypothetical protein
MHHHATAVQCGFCCISDLSLVRMKMTVDIERFETALDSLAEIIIICGEKGQKLLPLYESLETELTEMKSRNDLMSSVLARAKRSSDQTAARS